MDFSEAACAAIENWAARRRPEASNFRWVSREPCRDWNCDEARWTRDISDIQRAFEARIGFAIPFTPAEKRRTASLTMLQTHFILVRKAETRSGKTLLKALMDCGSPVQAGSASAAT